MFKRGLLFGLLLLPCLIGAEVRVDTLQGAAIVPYIKDIVALTNRIYREAPYYYNGKDVEYKKYLESYANSEDAIISVAFDGQKPIGLAAGMPMEKTRVIYKDPLIKKQLDLNKIFYLGEFGLQPEFQGKHIELQMLQKIEEFAKKKNFSYLFAWELDVKKTDNLPVRRYVPNNYLWKKLGFVRRTELFFTIYWANNNDEFETPHIAVFSVKQLTP